MAEHAEVLARGIETHKSEIIARWLERVRADVEQGGRRVEITDLQNAIGDYLSRLADSLRLDGNLLAGGTAAWQEVAREHAVTRVRLGFDIDELAHEFIVLRRTIPVVMMSALHDGAARARRAGADGFLQKPFSAEELVAAVQQVLATAPSAAPSDDADSGGGQITR